MSTNFDASSIFTIVWKNRGVYLITCGIFISVLSLVTYFNLLSEADEVSGKMTFKLNLKENPPAYPSKAPFSYGDILAPSNVLKVYKKNKISKYMEYKEFKQGLSILQRGDAISLLELEYQAKLGNLKLNVAQRKALEEEFLQKKEQIHEMTYEFRFDFDKFAPEVVIAQSLQDLLEVWVETSRQMGLLNVCEIVNFKNYIEIPFIQKLNPFVALNYERNKAETLKIESAQFVNDYPAAKILTVEGGVSFSYVIQSVNDVMQYRISLLEKDLLQTSNKKILNEALVYFESLQQRVKDEMHSLEIQIDTFQSIVSNEIDTDKLSGILPLQAESSDIMPQNAPSVGSMFINEIYRLARNTDQMQYINNINEKIISLGDKLARKSVMSGQAAAMVQYLTEAIANSERVSEAGDSSAQLVDVAKELNALARLANLIRVKTDKFVASSSGSLYSIVVPFVVTSHSDINYQKMIAVILAGFIFVLLISMVGVVLYHQARLALKKNK